MNDNSPLFVSAIELLAHAIEIFAQENRNKYKFIILHLANSVELILKDCLVSKGVSIYNENNQKTTLNIWECFKKLKEAGVEIPERPIIELLVDDRNTIQHRFGYPDPKTIDYYIREVAGKFFQRFLYTNYGLNLHETLSEHLPKEQLNILGLIQDQYKDTLNQLAKVSPELAIVKAYNYVEELILSFMTDYLPQTKMERAAFIVRGGHTVVKQLFNELEQNSFIEEKSYERLMELRRTRNRAAHSAVENLEDINWEENLKIAEKLINGLRKAKESGYQFKINDSSQAEESGYQFKINDSSQAEE
jgi:uncharacterized protein YutE (UPF0331/DUF86 family)